jgi:hypothetical protein
MSVHSVVTCMINNCEYILLVDAVRAVWMWLLLLLVLLLLQPISSLVGLSHC